jgi:deoxyribonuclease I
VFYGRLSADVSPVELWSFRRGGATKRPLLTVGGSVIGNRNSKIYHLPNCPDYSKVSERNRMPFATEAEAQAAGYRKSKNCPQ